MYTTTSKTIWFIGKGKKTKPTLVTDLLTHSNNTELCLMLRGAGTPVFKEATLKGVFKNLLCTRQILFRVLLKILNSFCFR